ncbi:MAG: GxxExxY protein [Calditrichaeota bacterium]|nr:GxxExxY protein [Calditrichota bacterium]
MNPIPENLNRIAREIVDAAYKVHKSLGPGLLESAYEACLAHEMSLRNLAFRTQVVLPVVYEGVKLDAGFRLDMLVEERLIVEMKAVEKIIPLHEAQLLTYLRLSNLRLGLLINFNVLLIKDGIKRMVV